MYAEVELPRMTDRERPPADACVTDHGGTSPGGQQIMQRRADPGSWHPASSADGSPGAVATLPASSANGAGATPPQLAPGVEQLGEYQGSGLTEATYLVRNSRGQVVQLSRLLHLVLSEIDGSRTASEIAVRATVTFGRTVSVGNVEYLLTNRLAPLALLATSEKACPGARAADQDILALKVRRTLVPAPAVQHVARTLGCSATRNSDLPSGMC